MDTNAAALTDVQGRPAPVHGEGSRDVTQSLDPTLGAAPAAPVLRRRPTTATYRVVAWSRWPLRLLFRPRALGLQHVPADGCVIASNQLSNLDGVAYGYALHPRQVWWLGKAELFKPVVGPVLRRIGIVPVRRGEGDVEALATMIRLARDGNAVGIFPEGTRRAKGWRKSRRPEPHTGTARVALAARVPLVPAAIAGTERLTLLRRWRMAFGPPVSTEGLPANRRLAARELTARLMAAIADLEAELAVARPTRRLYPRHRIDVSFSSLWFAARAVVFARRCDREERVLRAWAGGSRGVVCLSERTGFDLLLSALDLAPGGEVAMSAITHPDMARIVEAHGLRAVPVDVDPETLAPRPDALARAIGPQTRMILVAHLFGSRVDLAPLARPGVLLVEDCAQSFRGPHADGDPAADVSLFSFGSIKTATALGGALVRVSDDARRARMRELNACLPVQPRAEYARRVAKFSGLLVLGRPRVYALFARLLGARLDATVNGAVRGFPPDQLLALIRRRPSAPLLALLERRLRTFDGRRLLRRAELGERASASLPNAAGRRALDHSHWVFPVVAADPDALVTRLRCVGFDASRKTSAIGAVATPVDRPDLDPVHARDLMERVVFLPVYPELVPELDRLLAVAAERDA
jgi:dTDP-4-amino-4,6-dideoxygalactose transaminase